MDYMQHYALHMQMAGKAPSTIDSRTAAIRRAETIMGAPLTTATRAQLITWRATLLGNAATYVLAQVSHVRCLCTFLCKEGYRPDNPATDVPVPRKPDPVPHPIGEAELRNAIDNAPARIRLWLILAAFCGLRACEIAQLRRKYIRERADNPHIFIAADATKGSHEAVVPLRGYALDEVRAARLPLGEWLCPRLDGQGGHLRPHRVSTLCNEYLHSLGYPDTMHSLRHYFGTETLRASGNVRTTQRALRHRRLDTTAIYTEVVDEEVAAAVAAIPAPRRLRAA